MKLNPSFLTQTLRTLLLCLLLLAPVVGMCAEPVEPPRQIGLEIEESQRSEVLTGVIAYDSDFEGCLPIFLLVIIGCSVLGYLFVGLSLFCMLRRREKRKRSVGAVVGAIFGCVLLAVGVVAYLFAASLLCGCDALYGMRDLARINAAVSGLLAVGVFVLLPAFYALSRDR